ncbi:MAG: energy-coupling factor ABC transporter permease [Candidatus Onthomonas sp.]
MHMADALLSPTVGLTMAAVSAGTMAYSVKKLSKEGLDEKKIPVMGVMGAFVFAGQMINFTIPGTGSSGHIGGGILLAALLGPEAALLTLAAVLVIQCLFFADGGLLALGCNIFNMGVCAAMVAYPLIFRPIVKKGLTKGRITLASVLSVVLGLQLGAFCVVLETALSGVSALPFSSFVLLMQPIHLAIGLVEGLVTAAVLCYVYSVRPELLECNLHQEKLRTDLPLKKVLVTLLAVTVLVGGGLSLFASSNPDGLEWSIAGVAGSEELEAEGGVYDASAAVVNATALLPDYAFSGDEENPAGTTVSGLVGSAIVLAVAGGAGVLISKARKHRKAETAR